MADFWETKPFATWSDAELQQMLSDSPWARKITVADPAAPIQALISWRSALPMKQGLIRSQIGATGTLSAEAKALLDRKELAYVVTVDGFKARNGTPNGNATSVVMTSTGKKLFAASSQQPQ